ncbi:MAG: hypothetical protein GY751_10455 [Bacteroidetes bacterium]|nr:hypothetical protein [Bacteroidota bacterium]|tara:strand:+ start:6949 stop:7482 length:534 start_codon:yes stop_codon:yes gene_type:complete
MAIRRQGWTVEWDDDGSVPVSDLTKLYTGESIFYDNPGATNRLTSRNRTKDDQFIVLQYYGSTPGRTNTTESELDDPNDWSPGTYMQYKVGTTYYFQNLDGVKNDGMPGSAAPYPISITQGRGKSGFRPVLGDKTYIPVEIPPGTDWDIILTIVNSWVDPRQPLDCSPNSNYTWAAN